MDMGYETGGKRRDPWWRKTAARKQMSAMLEAIWRQQVHGVGNPAGGVRAG